MLADAAPTRLMERFDSYPVGPFFDERLQETLDFESNPGRGYSFATGDYSEDNLFKKEQAVSREIGGVVLCGIEVRLAECLEALLAQKDDKPVVGLDIGAGLGLTWLRLTKAFEPHVQSGDLILTTTNIQEEDYFLKGLSQDILDEYSALSAEVGRYVPTIRTPFRNIPTHSIPSADRGQLPLLGNTSLVHEQRALTLWGKVPEVEIVGAGRLLAPQGVGFFRPPSEHRVRDPYFMPAKNAIHGKWLGVDIAHTVLRHGLGLRQIDELDRDGAATPLNYRLFCGPQAPFTASR